MANQNDIIDHLKQLKSTLTQRLLLGHAHVVSAKEKEIGDPNTKRIYRYDPKRVSPQEAVQTTAAVSQLNGWKYFKPTPDYEEVPRLPGFGSRSAAAFIQICSALSRSLGGGRWTPS